ncbi:MarR family winged helix-turn-helix transcriptional regulator [Streptomonospora nanhaiensis]|uniref:DNA-binding MarR family transcriptional regulator n=1 Tax=Streptomonospora nanhaiensis TaxID=1323731 RepID=A0A853BQ75_9ACTN|nr:MarR family transcriptional regulator [Streptomonospora nanhaiensis]MBV2363799.1 MarR family transcriptional regulator [Streptomonospora nanhaiensis]MBX9391961.1 MarR family transcriptional regulator [Streptomonospora nanhaiensis]NYI97588.1 DNA-binding MarR family transcriptional regulator [Streptomonospora nanhaiensis]
MDAPAPAPTEGGGPPTVLAQRWCALSVLHDTIETRVERALQDGHGISTREYSVLVALSARDEGKMRMSELSEVVVLSQSATTRLVNRLEGRGLLERRLCADDRRGIYTALTEAGRRLLAEARPTNDAALDEALEHAQRNPALAPLAAVLREAPASA